MVGGAAVVAGGCVAAGVVAAGVVAAGVVAAGGVVAAAGGVVAADLLLLPHAAAMMDITASATSARPIR